MQSRNLNLKTKDLVLASAICGHFEGSILQAKKKKSYLWNAAK